MTLREALVTTYLTSPRLEAGRSELRQVDELVPQALGGYRPSLSLDSGIEEVEADAKVDGVTDPEPHHQSRRPDPAARTSMPAAGPRLR